MRDHRLNKKWLYKQYVKNERSISDIAKILFGKNIKSTTVWFWLKKYNIKRRGFSGHKNQITAAHNKRGKYSAWNKGKVGIMPPPWNKGKGKRYFIDKNGYKWVKSSEFKMSNGDGYIAEHRLVMARILGRPLNSKEIVHHRNKNRQDNDPSNLTLIMIGEPNAHKVCCPKCSFEFMIK